MSDSEPTTTDESLSDPPCSTEEICKIAYQLSKYFVATGKFQSMMSILEKLNEWGLLKSNAESIHPDKTP